MASNILYIEPGSRTWRDIVNYNFELLNASNNGISVYDSVPAEKEEAVVFVSQQGLYEWNTAISPNAYTKNTYDLQNFAQGVSGYPKIQTDAFDDFAGGDKRILYYGNLTLSSLTTAYTSKINFITHRKGAVRFTFGLSHTHVNDSAAIVYARWYKNGAAIGTERSLSVSVGETTTGSWSQDLACNRGDSFGLHAKVNKLSNNTMIATNIQFSVNTIPITPIIFRT